MIYTEKTNGSNECKCNRGINELLEEIYRTEHKSLELFAFSKLRDHHLAEVAVQEAFTLALEKDEKIISSPDPVKWIYETVRYISLHSFRERQYLLNHLIPIENVPESNLDYEDSYTSIPSEISNTPEMKLLCEFYIEGYSVKELAEKYEIEVGACKMRLLRARQKLAEKLNRIDYPTNYNGKKQRKGRLRHETR